MKRKLVLVLLLSITCLTGCVEYKATMDIKPNKSMIFSIDYAVDTNFFGDKNILDEKAKKNLEDKGYKVSPYQHDNMKGFHVARVIKNIDKYSSQTDTKFYLSGILNEENSNSPIFKVKKGIFKNIYYADFEFDASDSGLSDNEAEEEGEDEGDNVENTDDTTSSSMRDLSLSFNVHIPYKTLSNNADNSTDKGKKLSWNLSSNSVDNITFSFSLYNIGNIIIIGAIALLVLALIIMIIKKKISRKNLIAKEEE